MPGLKLTACPCIHCLGNAHALRFRPAPLATPLRPCCTCDRGALRFGTNNTINLRLWAAKPDREFDLQAFNTGDYVQVDWSSREGI